MKIFATGDTHGNFERFRLEYFSEGLERWPSSRETMKTTMPL